MPALDSYTPTGAGIVRLLSATYRAAPTADLVAELSALVTGGRTQAQLLNLLFDLRLPQSPFSAYATTATDAAFTAKWVDTVTAGIAGVDAAARASWTAQLSPLVHAYPSRGDFVVAVLGAVNAYAGTDAALLALKAGLAARAEGAAAFALTPAGSTYDGHGFDQLLAPLLPPPPPPPQPTYTLAASTSQLAEGQRVTFTLQTTHVAAGTSIDFTLAGGGLTAADIVGGQLGGRFTVDAAGRAAVAIDLAEDLTTEGPETLQLQLAGGHGQATATVLDTSLTPVVPPPPMYSLAASATAINEGGTLVLTLTTAQVTVGTVLPFTLSGNGITAADVLGGQLGGVLTVGAGGTATASITLVADGISEGPETLQVALMAGLAQTTVTINDTSITPPPPGSQPDLVIVGSQGGNDLAQLRTGDARQVLFGEGSANDDRITVKIGAPPNLTVVWLLGVERFGDSVSDDVYDYTAERVASLTNALNAVRLIDNDPDAAGPLRGTDHDTIRVADAAIGFNGSGPGLDLDNLGATVGGFDFDFDVLDVTRITTSGLFLRGGTNAAPAEGDPDETADNTDELVLAALSRVAEISDFEGLVLTEASLAGGSTFVWNAGAGTLSQGGTTVQTTTAVQALSFGGTVLEGTSRNGNVADATSGVTVTVIGTSAAGFNRLVGGAGADRLSGSGGTDILQGGAGNDTLDGGATAEVRTLQLGGILDAAPGTVTLTLDGVAYTLKEVAAVADTDADGGDDLDILQGADADAVGAGLLALVNANLDELNASAAFGGTDLVAVSYDAVSNVLSFTFRAGIDVAPGDTITITDTDGGNFTASAEATPTQGADGSDTFVFAGTAAANGADTLVNFVAANSPADDLLDFTAFLGTATPAAGAVNFATTGLDLFSGAINIAVAFNKSGLTSSDVAMAAAPGKVALADGGRAVVLVTADVNGLGGPVDDPADGTNQPYLVYFVSNGAAGGTSDVTVTLVGTLNSASELSAANFFAGIDAFVP